MKKYKLSISVRKGLQDRHIQDIEMDSVSFSEFMSMKELSIFNPDSYLVFSIEELPEEVEK